MRRLRVFVTCLAVLTAVNAVLSGPISAAVIELRLGAPEPFAEGKSFGAAGPYVRIKGVARGELDPKNPRNQVIVNLDAAPVNARGWSSTRPTFSSCARPTPPRDRASCFMR
jgi:hypothetical protein